MDYIELSVPVSDSAQAEIVTAMLSDLPFQGPIGAVRVGLIDGKYVINPTRAQMEESKLELIYAGRPGQEVADPWYTGDFEATWQDVLAGCQGLCDYLIKERHPDYMG